MPQLASSTIIISPPLSFSSRSMADKAIRQPPRPGGGAPQARSPPSSTSAAGKPASRMTRSASSAAYPLPIAPKSNSGTGRPAASSIVSDSGSSCKWPKPTSARASFSSSDSGSLPDFLASRHKRESGPIVTSNFPLLASHIARDRTRTAIRSVLTGTRADFINAAATRLTSLSAR
jgi:hypothetical protein